MKGFAEQLLEGASDDDRRHFSLIDRFFAKSLLKDKESQSQQLLLAALLWSSRQGHLCLPLEREEQLQLLAGFEEHEKLVDHLQQGIQELSAHLIEKKPLGSTPQKPLCQWETSLYLQKNWFFEARFIEQLEKRLQAPKHSSKTDSSDCLEITGEQQEAVRKALNLPLSLICGGPGTGKTYTAASIVRAFLKQNPDAVIRLAAPTGKAAKQLQIHLERYQIATQVKVTTLHTLLNIHSGTDFFPMPSLVQSDLLIVDECSMIDARLFSHLLAATSIRTSLVLLGDPHQLPPIETGCLFADLIDVLKRAAPDQLSFLTGWLRSDKPEILRFAEAIRDGQPSKAWEILVQNKGEELGLIELDFHAKKGALTCEILWQNTHKFFPATFHVASTNRFCLLSCLRKGVFGVDHLNKLFSERFLSQMKPNDLLPMPILITQNCEELDLCNGETGVLIHHFSGEGDYVIFGAKKIPLNLLPSYEYAYALSVHKSQGSEYEHVCLLIPPGSENFGKEIIYTGATRAKKSLKIASDQEVFERALARPSRKISSLHARLSKNT